MKDFPSSEDTIRLLSLQLITDSLSRPFDFPEQQCYVTAFARFSSNWFWSGRSVYSADVGFEISLERDSSLVTLAEVALAGLSIYESFIKWYEFFFFTSVWSVFKIALIVNIKTNSLTNSKPNIINLAGTSYLIVSGLEISPSRMCNVTFSTPRIVWPKKYAKNVPIIK